MPEQRALSLHQLSLMELSPVELVRVAGEAGFDHICVFTKGRPDLPFPLLDASNGAAFRSAVKETGVTPYNIELFSLEPHTKVEEHRAALGFGAEMGGTRATAFFFDQVDDQRMIDQFGEFCDLAQELGVKAGLEFMAFTTTRTLDHAMKIIRGAAHPNGTLALDALHLMRNGVGPADLDRLNVGKDEIGYIQFCDGPLTIDPDRAFDEATRNRTPPGQGQFPLGDFLAHLPEDRTLSIECPVERMSEQGLGPIGRARLLHDTARAVLAQFETSEGKVA